MLPSAIIVFREVFEIALIMGIVLAATAGIPHRKKAIFAGLGAGLLGSLFVAFFTGKISNMADGLGQEYFNAGILFTAAAFIGWTLLWMKRHAREMKGRFSQVSQAISDGSLPFFSLSIIIAFTILREGSEIALFTYGMLASGQSPTDIIAGSSFGMVSGIIVGTLFYLGLIKLSMRVFFAVTSWLLVFLVAGMASQAVGFLSAAGVFEDLSYTVWNTSWLIGEQGFLGQSLKTMIGYTAQPTAIQLITYTLTLGTLIMLMKFIDNDKNNKKINLRTATTAVLAFGLMISLAPAQANAGKKVYSPYVEKGELEVEWKGRYEHDDNSDVDGKWVQKLGVGYGFTDYWYSEIAGEVEKEGESDSDATFTAVEWENKFQLTQPGEYFVDFGVLTELVINTDGGADKGEVKLLLAKDTGDFTHMANIIAEREFGEKSGDDTEFGLSWGTRYRYSEVLEPGVEWYSDFGAIDNGSGFDEEKHMAGPVVYGKMGPIKYDVGYLVGLSDAAPDGTFKAILEYETHF